MQKMSSDLTLEKLKIDERLRHIEAYIIEGKVLRIQIKEILQANGARLAYIEEFIDGKGNVSGIKQNMHDLKSEYEERKKTKDSLLKIAVGAITMAVGAFVLWVCKLVWGNIGK